MKKLSYIVAVVFLSMYSFQSFAQNDTIIEEIDAIGKGKRSIKPTPKASLVPDLVEDTSKTQIQSEFVFYEYTAPSELQLQPISPAKLKVIQPLDKLKRGYIKGGIGMYTTPLAEIYYNSLRSRNSSWGIQGRHISSNSSLENTGFSGLSENKASAYYQHFTKKSYWKGEVNYQRDANHFYGFNAEDTTIDRELIHQAFNTIGGRVSTSSFDNDTGELNYSGSLAYYNYSDKYSAQENNVVLDFNAKKLINSEQYSLDFGVDFNNYTSQADPSNTPSLSSIVSEPVTVNNTIVKVIPSVITSGKKWYVKAGIGIFADIQDKTRFHFRPNIEAKYNFLDIFIPYVGIKGGLKRNSFKSFTTENPFLLSQVSLANTDTRYDIYAGVRGSISSTLSFNLQASRKSVYGQALFVTDTAFSIGNRMDVVYDSLDITEISAQVMYDKNEKLRVFLKGKYNFFSPLNQAHVWNIPALDITLGGVYDLADKILVRSEIYFVGERKARVFAPGEDVSLETDGSYSVNLKAFVDFNLGFEYRYSKTISAYVNFNNIISQRYLMYYQYPVQGINIMGGATFRF